MEDAERAHRRVMVAVGVAGTALAVLAIAVGWLAVGALQQKAEARERALRKPLAGAVRSKSASASPLTSAAGPTSQGPAKANGSERKRSPAARPAGESSQRKPMPKRDDSQRVSIRIGEAGYEPSTVTVRAGTPVVLTVARGEGCAAGFLMPALGVNADNSGGPAVLKLGRLEPGTYRFTCGMEMVEGRLLVQ